MIEFRSEQLADYEKEYGASFLRKVEVAATNKTQQRARTFLSVAIRKVYNVKASAVAKRTTVQRATARDLRAMIRFRGPRVGLINFSARDKKVTLARKPRKGQAGLRWGRFRTGATVKVLKSGSRKLITSKPAFIATGANGNEHVFARKKNGKGRKDIYALKTFSIPEMIANSGSKGESDINEFVGDTYAVEFDRAMKHFSSKQK